VTDLEREMDSLLAHAAREIALQSHCEVCGRELEEGAVLICGRCEAEQEASAGARPWTTP
jgi:hypothetical protein